MIYKHSSQEVSDLKLLYLFLTKYQIYLNPATHLISKYITKSKNTKNTNIQAQFTRGIRSKVSILVLNKMPNVLKSSNTFDS